VVLENQPNYGDIEKRAVTKSRPSWPKLSDYLANSEGGQEQAVVEVVIPPPGIVPAVVPPVVVPVVLPSPVVVPAIAVPRTVVIPVIPVVGCRWARHSDEQRHHNG
jgi:hypothetical protein